MISFSWAGVKPYSLCLRKVRNILVRLRLLVSCVSLFAQSTNDCNCSEKYAGKVLENVSQRSEEHTSELQSRPHLVCRLLLEKKKKKKKKELNKKNKHE